MSNKLPEVQPVYEHYSVKDKDNDKSLVNILPSSVSTCIVTIPQEFLDMEEDELFRKHKLSISDKYLRTSFQLEYRRAMLADVNMSISNIVAGICDVGHFNRKIATNNARLAYIIRPPKEVHVMLEMAMMEAAERALEIQTRSPFSIDKETGKEVFDSQLAKVQQKYYADVMDRRRGHVLRQIEMTNTNKNIDLNQAMDQLSEPRTVQEIEAKIRELEAKKQFNQPPREITHSPEPIEAEIVSNEQKEI